MDIGPRTEASIEASADLTIEKGLAGWHARLRMGEDDHLNAWAATLRRALELIEGALALAEAERLDDWLEQRRPIITA